MSDFSRRGGDIPALGVNAKEKAERDARWVGDWSDNLTVAIALKEWELAVDLAEQGQAKAGVMPALAAKLPPLKEQLVSSLLHSLSLPSNRRTAAVTLISLLNRLKAGAAARKTFLEMRAQVIQNLVRKIPFEGYIETYIGELAIVFFIGIKHTADWYLASFKENEVASSFISWTKGQIEEYCKIFRRQVYTKDVDPKVVQEVMQITFSSARKHLQDFGLDFRYLLEELLVQHPKEHATTSSAFDLHDKRLSKQVAFMARQLEQTSSKPASPAIFSTSTPPPMLAPAPTPRRRSPLPTAPSPAPSEPTSTTEPLSLSLSRSPTSRVGDRERDFSVASSPRLLSATLPRSRTPVSATGQYPSTNPSNPMPSAAQPRPAMRRDRSDSIKSRESDEQRSSSFRDVNQPLPSALQYRPSRSARSSPAPRTTPVPPPPRSANRPDSAMGQRPPVAYAQREGMI